MPKSKQDIQFLLTQANEYANYSHDLYVSDESEWASTAANVSQAYSQLAIAEMRFLENDFQS